MGGGGGSPGGGSASRGSSCHSPLSLAPALPPSPNLQVVTSGRASGCAGLTKLRGFLVPHMENRSWGILSVSNLNSVQALGLGAHPAPSGGSVPRRHAPVCPEILNFLRESSSHIQLFRACERGDRGGDVHHAKPQPLDGVSNPVHHRERGYRLPTGPQGVRGLSSGPEKPF